MPSSVSLLEEVDMNTGLAAELHKTGTAAKLHIAGIVTELGAGIAVELHTAGAVTKLNMAGTITEPDARTATELHIADLQITETETKPASAFTKASTVSKLRKMRRRFSKQPRILSSVS